MALSRITITFNEFIPFTETLGIDVNLLAVPTSYSWTWRTSRDNPFEVTQGSPTGNVGETSAINFAEAFALDVNSGLDYTVVQTLNVVEVTAVSIDNVFTAGVSSGNVTFVIGDDSGVDVASGIMKVRSPYFIHAPIFDGAVLINPESVEYKLFIWSGDIVTDKPSTPTYTYNKVPRYLQDNNLYLDVSEQIQDFIEQEYNGVLNGKTVFVSYDITTTYDSGTLNDVATLIAFDGFGSHAEGVNPLLINDLLIDNRSISVPKGVELKIPFYTGNEDYTIESRNGLIVVDTNTFNASPITDTANSVIYLELDSDNVNNIRVINDTQATEFIIDVEVVEECIYEPIEATFLNKNGVLQSFWFYKVSKESMKVKRNSYNVNILDESVVDNKAIVSYSTTKHNKSSSNTQGKTSIEVNSGYVDEDNNTLIKQMLLSNYVWLTIDSVVYPVDVDTKSVSYMTRTNDQLIKYKMKFDYSFDEIQNIR